MDFIKKDFFCLSAELFICLWFLCHPNPAANREFIVITKSILQDTGAGLVAAATIAIVPGYISRSVAGSYDNEGNMII